MSDVEIPTSQDPAGWPAAVADRLAAVAALRRLADQLEDVAVEEAMRAGWSWPEVAEALGVTRQAVHKKHAKRLIAAGVKLRRRR
jgi:predicted transcriptional regulator